MDFYKLRSTWWSGNCYHKEQLDAILNSPDVRSYAWICHDRCKNERGENLKPHFHFLLQFTQTQRGSWFKAFTSQDMGIVFIEPTRSPIDAFNYLIHDTDKCRKEGKFLYDQSERVSTISDFTGDEKTDNENLELYNDIDTMLENKMTWREFIRKKPKRLHMIANIKVAYDLLYFEQHGARYFDAPHKPYRQPPTTIRRPRTDLQPLRETEDLPF